MWSSKHDMRDSACGDRWNACVDIDNGIGSTRDAEIVEIEHTLSSVVIMTDSSESMVIFE
jgi:hypothetical protein